MPSGKPYDPHVKARAMAALKAGQSVPEVARATGVPVSTLRKWKQELKRENLIESPEKKAELGELVADYLTEILTTLTAQSRFARDEDWLRKQNAADVAILHGVLNDKAIRILAALQSPDEQS